MPLLRRRIRQHEGENARQLRIAGLHGREFEDSFGQKRAEALRSSLRSVLQSGFSPWSEGEAAASGE